MGIFDFITGAGEDVEDSVLEAQERETAEKMLRAKLFRHLRNKDLEDKIEGLELTVAGEKVLIKGKVKNDDLREIIVLSVGNFQGVASVDDQLEVPEAAPEPEKVAAVAAAPQAAPVPEKKPAPKAKPASVFHTVVSGDTLWAIAEKHLGDGNKYMAIFEANKPMLSNPDSIYPGQKLRIPK